MVSKEVPFEELILNQIPEQKYHQADFTSLPQDMRTFLQLLYPNPRDQIAYVASEYYEQVVASWMRGWVGVVQTQDSGGAKALLIQWQPQQPVEDVALLEDIRPSFNMLTSLLKPFFRIESVTSLLKDNKESAIILAQGYFGTNPTHLMEGGSIAPVDLSWPASLIWEKEFNQSF